MNETLELRLKMRPISQAQLNGQILLVFICMIGYFSTGTTMIIQNFVEFNLEDFQNFFSFILSASWILLLFFQREIFKHHKPLEIIFNISLVVEILNLFVFVTEVAWPDLYLQNVAFRLLHYIIPISTFIIYIVACILFLNKKYIAETRIRLFRIYIFWFLGMIILSFAGGLIIGFASFFLAYAYKFLGFIYYFSILSLLVLVRYYFQLKRSDPNDLMDEHISTTEKHWPPISGV
jgi:hypothetical protein